MLKIGAAAAAAIVLAPPRTALATPRPNQLSAAVAQLSAGALHPPFPLLSAGVGSSTSTPLIPLPSRPLVTAQRPASSTFSVIQSQRWVVHWVPSAIFCWYDLCCAYLWWLYCLPVDELCRMLSQVKFVGTFICMYCTFDKLLDDIGVPVVWFLYLSYNLLECSGCY